MEIFIYALRLLNEEAAKKMAKTLGIILIAIGVICFAFSYQVVRSFIKIQLPASYDFYIMGAGLVLLVIGILLIGRVSSSKQPSEVPIYSGHGKHRTVVAYQRMGKQ